MKNHLFGILILLAYIFCGVFVLLYVTHNGIGASPDSATYIGTAQSLLDGIGFKVPFGNPPYQPLTQFPPLYPLAIAIAGKLDDNFSNSLRYLNIVLLLITIVMTWLLLNEHSPKTPIINSLSIAPIATSFVTISIYQMAWSESLFLAVGLSSLFFFSIGIHKSKQLLIIFAGFFIGLTILTRLAGLVFLVTALLVLFSSKPLNFLQKSKSVVSIATSSLILPFFWFWSRISNYGNATNRVFAFHPIDIHQVDLLFRTVASWFFLPAGIPLKWLILGMILFFGLCGKLLINKFKWLPESHKLLLQMTTVFIFVYFSFLIVSATFFDANMSFDNRLLSPIFISFWIIVGVIISYSRTHNHRVISYLGITILSAYPIISLVINISSIQQAHDYGFGFYSQAWQNSSTIQWIKQQPDQIPILTNSPEAIYLQTGRTSSPLPKKIELMSTLPNPDYKLQINNLPKFLNEGGSIVYFSSIKSKNFPSMNEIYLLGLSNFFLHQFYDGWVLTSNN